MACGSSPRSPNDFASSQDWGVTIAQKELYPKNIGRSCNMNLPRADTRDTYRTATEYQVNAGHVQQDLWRTILIPR